jgi:hypothetical protein
MTEQKNKTATAYRIKATPKDGTPVYYKYEKIHSLSVAQNICDDCNRLWGERIVYEVIEVSNN